MVRLIFTIAIFLMTFSHQLIAAEAQLKKTLPLTQIYTPACIAAHDKCLEIATSKDLTGNTKDDKEKATILQNCIDACELAKNECSPKKATKDDLTHTRFGSASGHSLNCRKAMKEINTPSNKK